MTHQIIGILGSGNIGAGVATMATNAGLPVVLGNSRGPESLGELVEKLGDLATAATAASCAAQANLIVIAVPLGAYAHLPHDSFAGKTVIDATNYYPERAGRLDELDASGLTSSEFLQQQWPDARVVKALNNVDFIRLPQLVAAAGSAERSALPVAGDDAAAVAEVVDFLGRIGFDALELGGLSEGWRSQPGTPIHVAPYSRDAEPVSADPFQRFVQAVPVAVPTEQARRLADDARRVS